MTPIDRTLPHPPRSHLVWATAHSVSPHTRRAPTNDSRRNRSGGDHWPEIVAPSWTETDTRYRIGPSYRDANLPAIARRTLHVIIWALWYNRPVLRMAQP